MAEIRKASMQSMPKNQNKDFVIGKIDFKSGLNEPYYDKSTADFQLNDKDDKLAYEPQAGKKFYLDDIDSTNTYYGPEFDTGDSMEQNDHINHPNHYCYGGLEVIEILRRKLPADEFKGYLYGTLLTYIFRHEFKGSPVEDLKKAKVYLDWLIEVEGKKGTKVGV